MEQWKIDQLVARLKIIRYLLSTADQRGFTHGEKHHLIEVALGEIAIALHDLKGESTMQNSNTNINDIGDIPF